MTAPRPRCAGPGVHRPGRKAFVSGKKKQNTIKTTSFSDGQGRILFSGVVRPGRMHDQTAVRTEGIAEQFRLRPQVKAKVDDGYRGLANEFPDQISAAGLAGGQATAVLGEDLHRAHQRRAEEVASAPAIHRTPRELRRNQAAIASLVSDRSARCPTRHRTSTALVPIRTTTC
ncbi:transposase family protein [Streptomyces sp. NPDC088115]|uniref:transposase family protein n=1 Tax=Streptomyces sp. NPDC088115 TaxID=3365824 RepID=UPI0038172551